MSKKKKIGLIVLLAVLLISLIAGYTYSKYSSAVSFSTATHIAKWSFNGSFISGAGSEASSTNIISLADTISSDSIVANHIAPGTSGSFDIIIDATGSEVDIAYTVSISDESYKPQNLYFYYGTEGDSDYAEDTTLTGLLSQIGLASGTIEAGSTEELDKTINWSWPYESSSTDSNEVADYDAKDLADGQAAQDYVFTVNITGVQVNPNQG